MAYRFKSPHYSFVTFNPGSQHLENDWPDNASPYHNIKFCLPFHNHDDTAFQIIMEGDSTSQGNNIWNTPMTNIELAVYTGTPVNTISTIQFNSSPLIVTLDTLNVETYRLNDRQVLLYIPKLPSAIYSHIVAGQCFQLALRALFNTTTIRVASNCFRVDYGNFYTSLLHYRGNEDEAGFNYCISPTVINKVRLPLYTSKILYTEDQNVYRQSTGALTIIKAEIGKAYEVVTDYMPEWVHDCLQAALLHDTKTIISAKYAGNFHKSGNYELEHPKFMDYPLIPAKFKIDASPMLLKNNISGDCTPSVLLSGPSAYGLIFSACSIVELSLDDLGITALGGPLAITFSNVYTPPLSTHFAFGTTLVFHFKPSQPISANSTFILCNVKYENPHGNVLELEIQAEWNGSMGSTCY